MKREIETTELEIHAHMHTHHIHKEKVLYYLDIEVHFQV